MMMLMNLIFLNDAIQLTWKTSKLDGLCFISQFISEQAKIGALQYDIQNQLLNTHVCKAEIWIQAQQSLE